MAEKRRVMAAALEPSQDLTDLRSFVQAVLIPRAAQNDRDARFDHDTTRQLWERGLLNVLVPKEFGGTECSVSDLVWIARELGYGSAGVAATFIGNLLGFSAMILYANSPLREKLSRQNLNGFQLWSFAMTEKGCGSDLEKTATTARRVPGGYEITGEKNFITNATHATQLSVFAAVVNENGEPEGITCFYIPGDSPGLRRGDAVDKMGWRESNTGHLHFDRVFVPEYHRLGDLGAGLKVLTHCLNRSKTLLGAVSVGVSTRALDMVVERLLQTNRYGRPLTDQSAIRHLLARLHTEVEAAWLLALRAAAVWDSGDFAVKEASMAKLFGGNTASKVTSQAVELFGARGFINEYEVSRLMRDAKAIEIVEGPSLVQELLIAKKVIPEEKASKKIYQLDEADARRIDVKKKVA